VPSQPSTLLFNPFDAGLLEDPYPVYRRLREQDPVHRSPLGFWVLSRYRDVTWAQQDPRLDFFSARARSLLQQAGASSSADSTSATLAVARRWLVLAEPERHRRFRSAMGRCFSSPHALDRLRPHVVRAVDELLDSLSERRCARRADLMAELVRPLPTNVAAAALGMPSEDRERCRRWAVAIGRIEETGISPARLRTFRDAVVECEGHLRGVLARRAPDAADVLSALGTDGREPSEEELVTHLTLVLFSAAYATTVGFLGNSILALLRHPDQLDLLRREPSLAPGAVEELLRYDTSSQHHSRWTLADVEVGGRVIPAGNRVVALMGAANRDPEQFPDPDRLDLTRPRVRPASFGGGPHVCLGAALARLQAQTLIPRLLERFPRLGPVLEPPRWRTDSPGLRWLDSLVVSLEGRPA